VSGPQQQTNATTGGGGSTDAVEAVLHREAQVDEGVREVRHEQVGERWLR
jgi:hypothetical protein